MSKFFPGCPVRYARSELQENIGATGVVFAIGAWKAGDLLPDGRTLSAAGGGVADCYVRWDRRVVDSLGRSVKEGPTLLHLLEPIVPPHEASQYSFTELMDRCRAGEVEA